MHALRHSSIVRQILRGAPVRVVASVAMIERNYSAFISDLTDGLTRAAVFDVTAPAPYVAAATRAESFR